eukprot:scaffold7703_cov127-Cylindrotheca_fusiformis.AAC.3
MLPWMVRRGSGAPSSEAVWPMLRRAPSTVRDRTWRREVLMRPCRNREGSESPISAQKSSHLDQWARVCWAREGTTPRALSCDAERRSRRKESTAAGGIGARGDIGNRGGGEARSVVGHAIEFTRDVVTELGVAVETLVECHQAQEGGSGGGSGDRALAIPVEGGQVVGTRLDGAFPNVETVGSHGVMQESTQQFKLGVVEGSVGIVKADEGS